MNGSSFAMPVSKEKLIELSGLPREEAEDFLALGWIVPLDRAPENGSGENSELEMNASGVPAPDERFDISGADKIARAASICREFSVPPIAGAMITDLMDRIDELEAELASCKEARRATME